MPADRVKLSEYITHLQGVIEKYGDMDMLYASPSTDAIILKDCVSEFSFCGDGPYLVTPAMIPPEERRRYWREGTCLKDSDVGKYFYSIGSGD